MKKIFTLFLTTAILLAGCSAPAKETPPQGEATGTESISQSKDIVAAISVDFTTMDPLDTSDTLSGGIQRLLMDGLFGFDDNMELIPLLASEYTANENATEYIISLREGISFSDGTPWNAEAAKVNFDRWGDKTLGLKRTTLLSNILSATEVVDEYTIKVTLQEPFGAFVNTLAHPACLIVSPGQIAKGEKVVAEEPIGTGQYTFVEWVAGERAVTQLNKNWWGYDAQLSGGTALVDADAGFNTIKFVPVAENATRVAMMQAGDAQVTWPAPGESIDLLKGDGNLFVEISEGIVVRWATMNTKKAPFDNVKVRQALNYAIDKDAYCAVVKNNLAVPATSILGPAVQFYKENTPYPYDVEKAKALLAEAGYPEGFKTTLMCATTTLNIKMGEFLQQQLAQVGITLEIVALESAVLNERVQDVNVDGSEAEVNMYITGWSPSTGDADWGIRPLLASESFPPMSFNMSYYENPAFDELLYSALKTADTDKRGAAYAEAQDIIWEDVPIAPLGVDSNSIVTSSKIKDVKIFPDGCINIRNGKMYS